MAVDISENTQGARSTHGKPRPANTGSPTNIANGTEKPKLGLKDDESSDNLVSEATPTDLISTTSVERSVNSSGEEYEVKQSPVSKEVLVDESNRHVKTNLKFTPTQSWLESVKSELPMNTIMR